MLAVPLNGSLVVDPGYPRARNPSNSERKVYLIVFLERRSRHRGLVHASLYRTKYLTKKPRCDHWSKSADRGGSRSTNQQRCTRICLFTNVYLPCPTYEGSATATTTKNTKNCSPLIQFRVPQRPMLQSTHMLVVIQLL